MDRTDWQQATDTVEGLLAEIARLRQEVAYHMATCCRHRDGISLIPLPLPSEPLVLS